MIYTATLNPALDYTIEASGLKLGMVNRVEGEKIFSGGKGVNVSIVLKHLGIENIALGFIAGFTGNKIESILWEEGCKTDFIVLPQGNSRINIKIKAEEETELNGNGPDIPGAYIEKLFGKLDLLQQGDILVLAGSIPKTLPANIYEQIMQRLFDKGVLIVVDATGELLQNVLKYNPFLIKPNHYELGELFHKELTDKEEIVFCAKELQKKGAKNVLVSMAAEGAIFITEEGTVLIKEAPKGNLVNSVGAGDSMVAGFLAGYLQKKDYEYAFAMGVAAGSASAFSSTLASKEEVLALL